MKTKTKTKKQKYAIITHKPYTYGMHSMAFAKVAMVTTRDPDEMCDHFGGCTFG